MPLLDIQATTLPGESRVRLTWTLPPGAVPDGVRVVRAEHTHPVSPDDGVPVADGLGITQAVDGGLKDGTIYYYSLFPFSGTPRVYEIDRRNRAAALGSAPSGAAAQMFALLPRIYHRYDTLLRSAAVAPADAAKGQLQRFLDLPGGQLDLFASVLASLRDAHDPWRVDGRLLPRLAAWLGWPTDFTLELGAQRRDLRAANALYQATGVVPTIEATVKRLVGAESRSKEMVHNVLTSNRPERLNLWSKQRDAAGTWQSASAPFSLDAAFDGRPALIRTADGALWLFYHVVEDHRSTIWVKQRPAGIGGSWTPSRPLVYRDAIQRDPTAAEQGPRRWVIWSVLDPATGRWSLEGRIWQGGAESIAPLPGDATADRRRPTAVVDPGGGLWLFWMERAGVLDPWTVKYSRHDGSAWEAAPPHALGGAGPVEEDLFACFDAQISRIRLFWCRRAPIAAAGGAQRFRIFSVAKAGLDPTVSDWGPITPIASDPSNHDDREPFAFRAPGGTEIAFSSNRGGSFAIWSIPPGGAAIATPGTAASERAPVAILDGGGTLLLHRSNRGVTTRSEVYEATETVDLRYSGGTAVDTRNVAKLSLRRGFDDFQTYTYDTGPGGARRNGDWYARDTVALYVVPPSAAADEVRAAIERLSEGLRAFMPATERAVFIPSADLETETIIPGLEIESLP